ncbi:MAG: disulfide bond formation protein B [Hyphomicrobiaceae bacterium]|nr:disulfide bond formation protein B [Hyphomicrobiaceae bacterium]
MNLSVSHPIAAPKTAYALGAAVMLIGLAVIAAALAFEHIGGYVPCPLCLQQRYAYYAAVPMAFFALVAMATGRGGLAAGLMFLIALAYLANAGLGVYHAGAEWKYWPGPQECGTLQNIGTLGDGGLLGALDKTRVVRCDEAPWRMAGLSFAGWNAVASFVLFTLALKSAFEARS